MPHYRPDPLEARAAIRRALVGAGLTEVVTPALVPESQAARLAWPVAAADGVAGQDAVDGPAIRVRNPLSERHAVLRSGPRREPPRRARLQRAPRPRRRRDLRGRKGLRRGSGGRPRRVVAARASSSRGRRSRLLEPRGTAVGPRGREGAGRAPGPGTRGGGADVPAARRRRARSTPGARPAPRSPGRSPGSSARSTPRRWPTGTSAPSASSWGSWRSPGWPAASWPRRGRRRSTATLRSSATSPSSSARRRRPGPSRPRCGRPGSAVLRSLELFDVYRGAPLAAGEKSLAWRLRLQADDGALDEAAVEAVVARLVEAVAASTGAGCGPDRGRSGAPTPRRELRARASADVQWRPVTGALATRNGGARRAGLGSRRLRGRRRVHPGSQPVRPPGRVLRRGVLRRRLHPGNAAPAPRPRHRPRLAPPRAQPARPAGQLARPVLDAAPGAVRLHARVRRELRRPLRRGLDHRPDVLPQDDALHEGIRRRRAGRRDPRRASRRSSSWAR